MPKKKSRISKQKIYRITISKTFSYPSCVIDEGKFLNDLHFKAVGDFIELAALNKINASDFDIKLESELPFTVKDKKFIEAAEEDEERKYSLEFILKEIVLNEIIAKYGPLDPNKNPDLFAGSYEELIGEQNEILADDDLDDPNDLRERNIEAEPSFSGQLLKTSIIEEFTDLYFKYHKIFTRIEI